MHKEERKADKSEINQGGAGQETPVAEENHKERK